MKKLKSVDGNYRLYSLTNMYLSGIQKGIQTAHVVSEIAADFPEHEVFLNWIAFDKTIIVLDGGNCMGLRLFEDLLINESHGYPWMAFREDEDSLNGAITAIGIILPESVWSGKTKNKANKKIYNWIKDLRLAV